MDSIEIWSMLKHSEGSFVLMRENIEIILFLALLGLVAALFSLPYIYSMFGDVLQEA